MFEPVSPKVDVQALEKAQLAFWQDQDVLRRTMTEREGGPTYVFYEGPPTANGKPGSHHVLARAFKDVFPRFKTMNGYYVLRKAGWDTHGLPVEIEVEKQLGFKHKHEIEEYGIAAFNEKCRESVFKYIQDWERLTERIAFWVDLEQAYVTFKNEYIESVWWILSQFWNKDLLYRGYKVVPYCPRCGTPLASHEVNMGYKRTADPSLYVRFKVADAEDTFFLVWTTTPWTLPGNVALAVGANIDYVLVEGKNEAGKKEKLYIAEALLSAHVEAVKVSETSSDEEEDTGTDDEHGLDDARAFVVENLKTYKVVKKLKGADLKGLHYEPLFDYLPTDKDHAYVVLGDFVSTTDGTGIVHMAPAFGADDLRMGQENDLPVFLTVAPDGSFIDEVKDFAGVWVKDADPQIVKHLETRGLIFRYGRYSHRYPFCWRCATPLLYYARPTWYIRTSSFRDKLVGLNKTINWVPEHIRDGRFGNWLSGNVDWALGRERYWGTPLPVWVCDNPDCEHMQCISGVADLTEASGKDQSELDLHRPHVDNVTWPCTKCDGKGTMRRVPELIDVWFDSGAMPVAQWGYPHRNKEQFEAQFPADYICEAIDQTRGWFYSLHAISTLLFDSVSFKNVICLGHILDGEGAKMSKSKGNIVDPWSVLDAHGADMLRWYMFTASPPGDSRRFSVDLVGQSYRAFWLTLWNTYSFFVTYANLDDFNPATAKSIIPAKRGQLDRWILAELNQLVEDVTKAYEHYDVTGATRPVEAFVDRLSNWYLRRSRRRFWKSESDADKQGAYLTLYECLVTVAKLLAPAMPFLPEAMYRNLVGSLGGREPSSVHLATWPEYDVGLIDQQLMSEMRLVTNLVSLGHAARNSAGVKVRQPLAEVAYALPSAQAGVVRDYAAIIADELNVKSVTVLDDPAGAVSYLLNPLPQELGPRFGPDFPKVQKALREGDASFAVDLLAGKAITVSYDGKQAVVNPSDVEVKIKPVEGYAVAQEMQILAALKTTLTDDLVAEGLAREFIRRVQTARREAGYDISDRIVTCHAASDKLARAIDQFADLIKSETLTTDLAADKSPDGDRVEEHTFDGETLTLAVRRSK